MKITNIILFALVTMLALLAGKSFAASTPMPALVVGVNGTADFVTTNYFKLDKKGSADVVTNYITVAKSVTFNNAKIYNLISNAVANAHSISGNTNIPSTTLPADGYIAFNPTFDGGHDEFFYVTNKSGYYFPLGGVTTNDTYYSWIELDTLIVSYGNTGFGIYFDASYKETADLNTQDGSVASTSTALLYIHDNPLSYDDSDNIYEYQANNMAIEIHGILKANITFKDGNTSLESASLTGTGNIILPGYQDDGEGEVTSATAKFTK
jgi:hypothetical protein